MVVPLGMVPLRINPIYTLYSGYLLGISLFQGLLGELGYHPKGTTIFPMKGDVVYSGCSFPHFDLQFEKCSIIFFKYKDTQFGEPFQQKNSVSRSIAEGPAIAEYTQV